MRDPWWQVGRVRIRAFVDLRHWRVGVGWDEIKCTGLRVRIVLVHLLPVTVTASWEVRSTRHGHT